MENECNRSLIASTLTIVKYDEVNFNIYKHKHVITCSKEVSNTETCMCICVLTHLCVYVDTHMYVH